MVCWGLAPLEATGAYIRAADEAGAGGSGGNSTQLLLLETDLAFSSLAAENSFVCGLADGGTRVACWGSGLLPELVAAAAGSGQAGQSVAAVLPGDASNAAVKLVTGDSSVCALLEDRSLECLGGCWVNGPRGRCSTGCILRCGPTILRLPESASDQPCPLCAGTIGGFEWGSIDGGAGDGSGSPFSPVLAGPGGAALEYVDVAAGAQHVCGVLINGSVACFGKQGRVPVLPGMGMPCTLCLPGRPAAAHIFLSASPLSFHAVCRFGTHPNALLLTHPPACACRQQRGQPAGAARGSAIQLIHTRPSRRRQPGIYRGGSRRRLQLRPASQWNRSLLGRLLRQQPGAAAAGGAAPGGGVRL